MGSHVGDAVHLIVSWRFLSCPSEGQSFQQQKLLGLWVIIGFLTFLVLEKIFLEEEEKECPGVVSLQLEGREYCYVWSTVLNTSSALSDRHSKWSWSCEYLVSALWELFATSLTLGFRWRGFISGLWFCGFSWDFSPQGWLCSWCGVCERELPCYVD